MDDRIRLFRHAEIAESDLLSDDRFDRLLDDTEIHKRIVQSVLVATRYKDEWAKKSLRSLAFELCSNKVTVAQSLFAAFQCLYSLQSTVRVAGLAQ